MTDLARATPPAAARKPSLQGTLASLLRADFTVQIRNRQSLLLSLILPLVFVYGVFAGKRGVALGEPTFRVGLALMLGIVSIALLGYTMTVARDRDNGIFQRLRVTPAPVWTILVSRLLVQVAAIVVMCVIVLIAADVVEKVSLTPEAYALTVVVAVLTSAVFLSIGQALVGLVKSATTLSAVTRLAYLPIFVLGILGQSTIFGDTFETVARWSPGGVVASMLEGAMLPATWNGQTWWSVLAAAAYSVVFAGIGIRWFQWGSR